MKIDYAKYEFEFQQRNRQPILMADMWMRCLIGRFKNEIQLPVPDAIDYIESGDSKGWVSKEHKRHILELVHKGAEDQPYLQRIVNRLYERLKETEVPVKNALALPEQASREELAAAWLVFDDAFQNFVPWYWIPWYITEENIITNKVAEQLKPFHSQILEVVDADNALLHLIAPEKKSKFQQEQESFYQLVLAKRDNHPDLEAKKQAHLESFAFLATYLFLPIDPLSLSDISVKLDEALQGNFIESYEENKDKQLVQARQRKHLLDIISGDEKLTNYINWAQEFGYFLTASIEDSFEVIFKGLPFYKRLAETIGISYDDFSLFTAKEIEELAAGRISLSAFDIPARRKGYFFIQESGQRQEYYGDEAVRLTNEINAAKDAEVDLNTKEFGGQIAFKGVVTGTVLLALTAQEAADIEEGQILVTSMTTPDYVPAMKKAGAIVTSEGGLLCHAAIISRELHKPCVVGTKIATQLLKTGMKVEVDADQGIVRIID